MYLKSILSTSLAFLLLIPLKAQIKGNGIIEKRIRSLSIFTELEVDFPAHVTVNCKELARLEISTDENVFEGIAIKQEGGKLRILQEKWISPSQEVKIVIGVPFLVKLKTGGYGNFFINNLDGPIFILDNAVGTVQLAGSVEQLTVRMKKGMLDALDLDAKKADVEFDGYGEAKIHVSEFYKAKVGTRSLSKSLDKAENIRIRKEEGPGWLTRGPWKEEKQVEKPRRIKLSLFNNSDSAVGFFVEGPKSHRFSYGFDIKSKKRRKESFPIGTRIYQVKLLGNKLLYTVSESDENQTISLFK